MTDEEQPPAEEPRRPPQTRSGTTIFARGNRGPIIANIPTEETLEREREVMRLRRDGKTFAEIAEAVGYSEKSAASKAYHRAILREHRPLIREARALEEQRLDELTDAIWAKAMSGSVPHVREAVRISQRRARLLGLDHADGVAERLVQIESDKLRMMALALGSALEELGLSEEQATEAKRLMLGKLRAMTAVHVEDAESIIREIEGETPAADEGPA